MQQYRNRLSIISDVLSAALNSSSEGGAKPSVMMRKCNLSYRALEQLASQLVAAGLLNRLTEKEGTRYVLSEKGCQYLRQYQEFESFAESYGLRL